ncbi:MAG: helix-turn-helix domain-containing protein [Burkholderiales bacterium]
MNQAPRIETARISGPFQIEIHWSTGEAFTTDLKDLIGPLRKEDPFCALHDSAFFAQGHADDWGDGLIWLGGLNLGADRLYTLGRKQAGLSTREDLVQWVERNNLSLTHAAEAIGMTRRMVAYYKNGSRPTPKTVWLAGIGYEVLECHAA